MGTNSMVDRITTGTTDADRALVADTICVCDAKWLVPVIVDQLAAGRSSCCTPSVREGLWSSCSRRRLPGQSST
ncbi:hypothetical protein E3T35_01770 [Cryobacterium sp. TMT1-2-2]|uniref:hypothetical protein n=1 Tax=Cryobacterium sp. TMT1-2-2 TaxID=1259233 RepID=UPI00106C147A|nr:hypothetical protein [Cryobacterium sp. TMT1-2-2]TFD15129.1 hypothetical protein E3T35_01770 [Cryobacterium sp. TMT1-2-2]